MTQAEATSRLATLNAEVRARAAALLPIVQGAVRMPQVHKCSAGGTVTITLASTEATKTATKTTLKATYAVCREGTTTLDGTLSYQTWTFSNDLGTWSQGMAMDGSIAYEGATYAGNFSFSALTIKYSGKDYTITGSYSIGGTTYEVDKSKATALFTGG